MRVVTEHTKKFFFEYLPDVPHGQTSVFMNGRLVARVKHGETLMAAPVVTREDGVRGIDWSRKIELDEHVSLEDRDCLNRALDTAMNVWSAPLPGESPLQGDM